MKLNLSNPELVVNGGSSVREKIWLDNFTTGEEEKKAVLRVLDKGYLSLFEGSHTPDYPFSFLGGPEVLALEKEWSDFYAIEHSVSMNSASSCLYAAVGALGLGYGDEIIVSPYTMTACAMAPMIYGAIPVFADVNENTGCLEPESIVKCITDRTKAILVVHQFGFPADMVSIKKIADKYDLNIIEDCAQAHGAQLDGRYVGSFGDIGVFSMNVNKTIQCGEGGICVTNDHDLSYRLQLIRNHGEAVIGPSNYENLVNIAGFNYRMTEYTAAIAREQLKKLDTLNKLRLEYVSFLRNEIEKFDFLEPLGISHNKEYQDSISYLSKCISTYYVFPFRFLSDIAGCDRSEFVNTINAEGFLFYEGYTRPLYLQPVYQRKILFKNGYPFSAPENQNSEHSYHEGICPVAEKLYNHQMVINEHIRPPNKMEDINDIVRVFEKVFSG